MFYPLRPQARERGRSALVALESHARGGDKYTLVAFSRKLHPYISSRTLRMAAAQSFFSIARGIQPLWVGAAGRVAILGGGIFFGPEPDPVSGFLTGSRHVETVLFSGSGISLMTEATMVVAMTTALTCMDRGAGSAVSALRPAQRRGKFRSWSSSRHPGVGRTEMSDGRCWRRHDIGL